MYVCGSTGGWFKWTGPVLRGTFRLVWPLWSAAVCVCVCLLEREQLGETTVRISTLIWTCSCSSHHLRNIKSLVLNEWVFGNMLLWIHAGRKMAEVQVRTSVFIPLKAKFHHFKDEKVNSPNPRTFTGSVFTAPSSGHHVFNNTTCTLLFLLPLRPLPLNF